MSLKDVAIPGPEADQVRFLGPAPQPLSRLKGKTRWHLAMRGERHVVMKSLCEAAVTIWGEREKKLSSVRLSVDVDPVDLL